MAQSRKVFVAVGVWAVAMLGLLAMGAPIVPSVQKPNDAVLSLSKVTRVEIVVRRLAPELRAAGVSEEELKTRWTKRLTGERFDVADGKGYPKLILRSITTVDPDVPGAVAFAFVVSFEQPVKIERLDQTLFVPTYTDTLLGQETLQHLGPAALRDANQGIDLFIDAVKKANRSGDE